MKKNGEIAGGRRKRRGNGGGTLRKIGNTYFAIFTVTGLDGVKRRVTRTTGKHSLEEARDVLNELAAEYGVKDAVSKNAERRARFTEKLIRAQAVVAADAERLARERESILEAMPALAIKDAWAAYELSGRRRANSANAATIATYAQWFERFADWMAKNHPDAVELRQVTPVMARAFCRSLEGKKCGLSINREIMSFSKIWNTLKKDDRDKVPDAKDPIQRMARLGDNPWDEVERYDGKFNTRRELTVEELARLISNLEGDMRLLFALGIYTGMRKGDCATLEWSMVDLVRGRLTVEPRKTRRHTRGRKIVIPLAPVLAQMLVEARRQAGSAAARNKYVMPELADEYLEHPNVLKKKINDALEKAGIERTQKSKDDVRAHTVVGFHSLRHTFVSLSANAGTPLAVVQSIVGHSSSAMTQRYYHENEDAMRGAVAMLPDVVQSDGTPGAENYAAAMRSNRLERFRLLWAEMSAAEKDAARGLIG